ncbi:MAG: hypothetical protein AB8G77_16050 [Rhodothermales bacterium]
MRNFVSLACLLILLGVAMPAQAQLRETALEQQAPTKLYDTKTSGFTLNKIFDPAHFRMSQSVEFSSSSYGGQASSLGMFTNSMMWQFNDKLAARVDVSAAYSPNAGTFSNAGGNLSGDARVFVQNAQIAYRPSENVQLHLSFHQSPYGRHGSPYGYYNPYGRMNRFNASYGSSSLFWNDRGE